MGRLGKPGEMVRKGGRVERGRKDGRDVRGEEGRGETGRDRKPNWFGHRPAAAGASSVCHT